MGGDSEKCLLFYLLPTSFNNKLTKLLIDRNKIRLVIDETYSYLSVAIIKTLFQTN